MTHTTKQTHTPGPWTVQNQVRTGNTLGIYTNDTWRALIADVTVSEQSAANATLIASAPELLAALESSVRVMDDIIGAYSDVMDTEHEPGWIFDLREQIAQNKAAIASATVGAQAQRKAKGGA